MKCPECKDGELVEKKARRRGNIFYGCSNYPKCKFTSAHKPVAEKCPECGHEYLVEKRLKSGTVIACPNKAVGPEEEEAPKKRRGKKAEEAPAQTVKCDYSRPVPEEVTATT
jgi:DNA topoisomerase-1